MCIVADVVFGCIHPEYPAVIEDIVAVILAIFGANESVSSAEQTLAAAAEKVVK